MVSPADEGSTLSVRRLRPLSKLWILTSGFSIKCLTWRILLNSKLFVKPRRKKFSHGYTLSSDVRAVLLVRGLQIYIFPPLSSLVVVWSSGPFVATEQDSLLLVD